MIFGDDVLGIDDESISTLYNEARQDIGCSSYTSSVMCCRKLLMHVAVAKGAEENKSFAYYVAYLSDNNYIPLDSKDWVDDIRGKGNEANHETVLMGEENAKILLGFVEMLLKIIFEFPSKSKKRASITSTVSSIIS